MLDLETVRSQFAAELREARVACGGLVAALYRREAEGGYLPIAWDPRPLDGSLPYVASASDLASYLRAHAGEPFQMQLTTFKDGPVRRGLASFGAESLFVAPVPAQDSGAYYITAASEAPLGEGRAERVMQAAARVGELMAQGALRAKVRGSGLDEDGADDPVAHVAACEAVLSQAREHGDFGALAELVERCLPARGVAVEDSAGVLLAQCGPLRALDSARAWLHDVARLPYLDQMEATGATVWVPPEFDELALGRTVTPLHGDGEYLGAVSFAGSSADALAPYADVRRAASFAFAYLLRSREAGRGRILRRTLNSLENDRLRVACELHDSASQDLVALKVRLATCGLALARDDLESAAGILEDCACIADGILDSVNRLAADLRPSELNYLGLRQAIESEAASRLGRAGIAYGFSGNALDVRFNPLQESMLLTGVVEALSNCARHSRAHRVDISIDDDGGWLTLAVHDDGCGFDAEAQPGQAGRTRYGMQTMRDCAEAVGGSFWVGSELGRGTTVRFSAPLRLLEEAPDE